MELIDEITLKEKLAELRQGVIEILLEIDNMTLQVNPQIQMEYAKKIGYLENDLFKWQLRARREKRKLALAQAAANRGENVQTESLDDVLDIEFAEWEAQLAKQSEKQLELLEALTGMRPLSPKEAREFKELHCRLIRRLHPDLHPDLTEEALRFFLIAQAAYESGDLSTLRVVDVATQDLEAAEEDEEIVSEDAAEIEIAMVQAQLNVAEEQLENLKRSHPYCLRELLGDPLKVAERQRALESQISEQKKIAKTFAERVEELKGDA